MADGGVYDGGDEYRPRCPHPSNRHDDHHQMLIHLQLQHSSSSTGCEFQSDTRLHFQAFMLCDVAMSHPLIIQTLDF